MGGTSIGKTSVPIYWDGDAFKPITSYEGNAATATKLGASTVGSAKQPIYLNDGTPTATTYNLQADIRYQTHNATTSGWKDMLGRQSNPTLSVTRHQGTVPTWIPQKYSSSLVFGGNGTKGLLSCGYNTPIVTFGGASTDNSTDDAPAWYFKLSGTSGTTYTFPTASKTLAATDGSNATGTWDISISGNASTATTASKLGTTTVGGKTTNPIYLNEGVPEAMTNISIVSGGTFQKYVEVGNDNGSVRLFASTNRGLYDSTKTKWIIYTNGTSVKIPTWADKGSTTKPIYLSAGEPAECTTYAGGTKVTLNNSSKAGSTASFYAPTTGGTAGYILKGKGTTTAPDWAASPFHTALTSKGTTATTTAGETYGVAGVKTGSATTIYTKWFVNLDTGVTTLTNGMIIEIKIPVDGVNAGCAITIDNGSNFHPVSLSTSSRFTTHFGVNDTIVLQYDSTRAVAIYGKLDGTSNGNSTVNITGCWRILTCYDSGNTNTLLRTYSSATNINVPLIGSSSANSTTAAWSTYTGTYKDWYGVIPNDDTKRAKINLLTGHITAPGGITANLTGNADTATKATKDSSGNTITSTYVKKSGDTMTGNLTLNKITGSSANYGDTLPATGTEGQIFFKTGSVETKIDTFYPVGSIYMSVNSANPGGLFGGTWEQIQNCFLLAAGSNYAAGSTGGSATIDLSHTHTLNNAYAQLVFHGNGTIRYYEKANNIQTWDANYRANVNSVYSEGFSESWGTGLAGKTDSPDTSGNDLNNMPPYLAVYVWKRTA